MGYYIRVLGKRNPNIPIHDLEKGLARAGLSAKFVVDSTESPDNWTVLGVANSDGNALMQIERNPVVDGEVGKEELEEFKESIKDRKPTSAVRWLSKYFDKVKVIYAFQLLDASTDDKNFPVVSAVKSTIWSKTGGILHADNEGFSNEGGYHILWQFSDDVVGEWSCAVRNVFGQWSSFIMNLGDQKQREEFWSGKVPKDATRL